ncbi:MAG: glycyl-radical enzyme activating protein [Oscillospiraceae bacterium]|nr:glycyl-radical enzyme activating protein [Oscillospiraceae bacterium]
MSNSNTGVVFDIQRFSIDDGPGIRTIVFLKGCPLRCVWCANPESQQIEPEIGHHYTACKACGKCAANCPQKAITMTPDVDKKLMIDRSKCDVCKICVDGCIYKALSCYGYTATVDELFETVAKDRVYYNLTGGGLTISGGEVTMQADFAAALLKKCKEADINTCIETCGFASEAQFRKVVPYTDIFLFDLKSLNDEVHKKWTGCSNVPILKNLDIAMQSEQRVIIRWPLIPTVNDTEENLLAMRDKLVELNKIKYTSIEIMPYHNFGSGKYLMTHREYELKDLERPSEELLNKVQKLFDDAGIDCLIHRS